MVRDLAREACIISSTKNYKEYSDLLIQNVESGLIKAKEIPGEKDLKKLYEQDYFFGKEYSDYIQDRPALEKNFSNRIKKLKRKGYLNKNTTLIEVGCAYGYFLNMVKPIVKSHQGFDVSKDGIDFAKKNLKVNATTNSFLDMPEKNKVDLICMWDLIEHVSDPDKFISKASKVTKPGGVLALTTGDIGALVPRFRKEKWRMIHPPTHVYYFDKSTINALLEKYDYAMVDFGHSAVYRNVGSVLNQLIFNKKAKGGSSSLLVNVQKLVNIVGLNKVNIPLNTFDIMEVVAVKK